MQKFFAILTAIEDGETNCTLAFASKKDATAFKKFVNVYMSDSGAGNGYGAYWVYTNEEIVQCDKLPGTAKTSLKLYLLLDMMHSVLTARMASEKHGISVAINIGQERGAITFSTGRLPPRQRPAVGDMFRVIKRTTADEAEVHEGRVVEDCGETLKVKSYWDYIKTIFTVNTKNVMKINDWIKEHRR